MTDDRRQEDFAERLTRIKRERGDAGGASDGSRDMSDFDYNVPRERHPVRNGIIWTIILAAMGAGGYFGWGALPADLKASLSSIVASGDDADAALLAPEDIPETADMSDQGAIVPSPAVAQVTAAPLSLDDVVTQVSLPTDNTEISRVIPIVRNEECNLRTPLSTEKVMGVRIENALLPAPLHAFSDQQLADQVLHNIEAVTQGGEDSVSGMDLTGAKTSLDVFVTDTSAPLYLVLQNMGPGVVWNLHAAPEVQIAHVAIIGSDFSGLANPQTDTTLEALLVSDFVAPHQYGADDVPRSCMIRPWRNPQPEWIGSLKSEAGSLSYQNQMYSYTKGYQAYNLWFTETLGVDAGTNTVSVRDAAHVLLGPQPATPFSYSPLVGQDLYMMEADHLFVGDATSRTAAAKQVHLDLLTAAIGGDVSALNPPALERNSQ